MKILLVILLSLCLVCNNVIGRTAEKDSKYKILTINVWSGIDYNGIFKFGEYETHQRRELRFQSLLTQIKLLDADIIFLQEANYISSYSSRLADSLGYDEIHNVNLGGIKIFRCGIPVNFYEGDAILARKNLSLQKVDVWKLSGSFGLHGNFLNIHFDESIFSLVGKITINQTPIYLVNVHLHSSPPIDSIVLNKYSEMVDTESDVSVSSKILEEKVERRRKEVNKLLNKLQELPQDIPVIVAGDFNADPESQEILKFKREGKFIDSYSIVGSKITSNKKERYFTWDAEQNENIHFSTNLLDLNGDSLKGSELYSALYDAKSRRIDYIFLSQHFPTECINDSRIVLNSPINGIFPSDHYGVMAEVDISGVLQNTPKVFETLQTSKETKFEPLPIISYDTDVGFGYGAKAFLLNYLNQNESFDVVFFQSTKGERWYRFVFSIPDFEIRQGKIYPLAFDLIFDYDKWIKNSFFGIGNNSSFADREYYTREPFEITSVFSRGFTKSFVGQFGLRYKIIRNFNFENKSKLIHLQPELNRSRVSYSSTFVNLRYDTRDSYINPSSGVVIQGEGEFTPKFLFNNVSFVRLAGWFQYYTVLWYPKTVLAFRLGLQEVAGKNLPIQILSSLGGNNNLRGSPQDRYLDKTSAIFNAELRFPIYWRFGGILGYDIGKVWSSPTKFDLTRWSANPTIGLRFYMETFVVRADVGFGRETTGFYFNFGHIF